MALDIVTNLTLPASAGSEPDGWASPPALHQVGGGEALLLALNVCRIWVLLICQRAVWKLLRHLLPHCSFLGVCTVPPAVVTECAAMGKNCSSASLYIVALAKTICSHESAPPSPCLPWMSCGIAWLPAEAAVAYILPAPCRSLFDVLRGARASPAHAAKLDWGRRLSMVGRHGLLPSYGSFGCAQALHVSNCLCGQVNFHFCRLLTPPRECCSCSKCRRRSMTGRCGGQLVLAFTQR